MLMDWIVLFLMLLLILISAQLFSNALEYFAEKINVSTGLTGSIFAAVATALPETLIPLLALLSGSVDPHINQQISIGAILGAPLMLSTLSTCILAISALKQRGLKGRIQPELSGFRRDLHFFMGAFLLAAIAMFLPSTPFSYRLIFSLSLISLYIVYVIRTIHVSKKLVASGHHVETTEPLLLSRFGFKPRTGIILIQLLLGLALLILSAKGFIHEIYLISKQLDISALLLSLLIIPLATELPEKVNSIVWVRRHKDTLGVGNITGAMVFQGTLLPAIGILLTPWVPNPLVIAGMTITLLAAGWLRFHSSEKGTPIFILLVNGLFYLSYLAYAFLR